jgi:YHS domain-containing protein
MKTSTASSLLIPALFALSILTACDKSRESQPAAPAAPLTAAGEQTHCPIMGEHEIDKEVSVDYQGKKVYFCCDSCIDDFNKEPEKYLSKLPQFAGNADKSEG